MLYDECPNCKAGYHSRCLHGPEAHKFICICAYCNALEYLHFDPKNYHDTLAYHIEQMTPKQWEMLQNYCKANGVYSIKI